MFGFIFPLFPETCLNPGLSWTSVGIGQGWGPQPQEEKKLWVAGRYLLACRETLKVQAPGVGAGRSLSAAWPRAPSTQESWDTKDSGSPTGEETGELGEKFFPCLGLFPDPSEPLRGAEPSLSQLCGQTQVAVCTHSYFSSLQTILSPKTTPRHPPLRRPILAPTDLGKAQPGRWRSLAVMEEEERGFARYPDRLAPQRWPGGLGSAELPAPTPYNLITRDIKYQGAH